MKEVDLESCWVSFDEICSKEDQAFQLTYVWSGVQLSTLQSMLNEVLEKT